MPAGGQKRRGFVAARRHRGGPRRGQYMHGGFPTTRRGGSKYSPASSQHGAAESQHRTRRFGSEVRVFEGGLGFELGAGTTIVVSGRRFRGGRRLHATLQEPDAPGRRCGLGQAGVENCQHMPDSFRVCALHAAPDLNRHGSFSLKIAMWMCRDEV